MESEREDRQHENDRAPFEDCLQSVGRATGGVAQGRGLVRDGGGLAIRDGCLCHAALIVLAALFAVLVAELISIRVIRSLNRLKPPSTKSLTWLASSSCPSRCS